MELAVVSIHDVKVSSMQGIFPTITKFGMAALLPHKELSVELKSGKTERLAVLADGQSTEANNRDKLSVCCGTSRIRPYSRRLSAQASDQLLPS